MQAKTLNICEAKAEEWKTVLAVTLASYAEFESKSDPMFWKNYMLSIEKTILTDDSIIRIAAKSDEDIMGTVLYCSPYEKQMGNAFVKNPFPEMRLLAVPPSSRNLGIAAKLIDYCEEKASSSGWKVITLHTTILMQTAKAMYERRGYERYTDIDFEPVPGFLVWGYQKVLVGG